MKKIYRKMLLFTSTVVFLSLAPLVILYAMGYRLASSTIDPIPVGVLLVETKPRRATLEVDGKIIGETPRSISNLPPGEVRVRVSKAGYIPWEKMITIEPGMVTETRDIWLFPEEREHAKVIEDTSLFSLSPNRQLLATVDSSLRIHVVDEDHQDVTAPQLLPRAPSFLLWSPDNSHVLIQYEQRAPQLLTLSGIPAPLRTLTALGAKTLDISWDPRIPARLLARNSQNVLLAYSITAQDLASLATNVVAFTADSRQIIAAHADGSLSLRNLQGEINKIVPAITEKPIQQLMTSHNQYIAMVTADREVIILDEQLIPTTIAKNAISASWSSDGQLLLLQTEPHSLHVYAVDNHGVPWMPLHQLHLITRLSRAITYPQWYAANRHVIYQVDDEVVISEIDTRDRAISHTIDSTNTGNAQIAVGTDGNILYYLKNNDATTHLISTQL
jgi:hypothetical protein